MMTNEQLLHDCGLHRKFELQIHEQKRQLSVKHLHSLDRGFERMGIKFAQLSNIRVIKDQPRGYRELYCVFRKKMEA